MPFLLVPFYVACGEVFGIPAFCVGEHQTEDEAKGQDLNVISAADAKPAEFPIPG